MKLIILCFLLATAGIADADDSATESVSPSVDSQLYERCIKTADQVLFDFPISRKIGVPIHYHWEPKKDSQRTARILSNLIAFQCVGQ